MNAPVLTEKEKVTARVTLRVLLVEDSEVDAQLILLSQLRFQTDGVFANRVQNAALTLHPAFIASAEDEGSSDTMTTTHEG